MADRDRFRGALLGLAAGDAVGTTVEFSPPSTFAPLTGMTGGGPFDLPAGAWTDDTSMALCLAESLVERRGFDPVDQLERYVRWYRERHWSSTGRCFDIGNATRAALERFERTAADACRYFALLLVAALNQADPPDPPDDLHPKIAAVAGGSYLTNPHIRGTGYVVDALEAALWAVHTTDSFAAAILKAADLGDDADTTAAIAGQLAGARYGVDAIPAEWRAQIVMRDGILALADRLMP